MLAIGLACSRLNQNFNMAGISPYYQVQIKNQEKESDRELEYP